MKEIATPSTTKYILEKYHLNALKKYGQNFLIDVNIINKIVTSAKIDQTTAVIDFRKRGPGRQERRGGGGLQRRCGYGPGQGGDCTDGGGIRKDSRRGGERFRGHGFGDGGECEGNRSQRQERRRGGGWKCK